jgi:hypothetical protein
LIYRVVFRGVKAIVTKVTIALTPPENTFYYNGLAIRARVPGQFRPIAVRRHFDAGAQGWR